MTCGVMGGKDWDEYLPTLVGYKPVIYTNTQDYGRSITFTPEEVKQMLDLDGWDE